MCGYFYLGVIDFELAGKTLIDYTSLFLPYDLKKLTLQFLDILKISDFNTEIQERNIMTKKLSKYIAAFDYS